MWAALVAGTVPAGVRLGSPPRPIDVRARSATRFVPLDRAAGLRSGWIPSMDLPTSERLAFRRMVDDDLDRMVADKAGLTYEKNAEYRGRDALIYRRTLAPAA